MASSIMATQALPVAGLRSSTLHSHPIKKLQGLMNVSKSSRLGFTPIRAVKLPRGVEPPKDEPKLPVSFWGFTENAEVWNARASLIGIVGIIIVEALPIGFGIIEGKNICQKGLSNLLGRIIFFGLSTKDFCKSLALMLERAWTCHYEKCTSAESRVAC